MNVLDILLGDEQGKFGGVLSKGRKLAQIYPGRTGYQGTGLKTTQVRPCPEIPC